QFADLTTKRLARAGRSRLQADRWRCEAWDLPEQAFRLALRAQRTQPRIQVGIYCHSPRGWRSEAPHRVPRLCNRGRRQKGFDSCKIAIAGVNAAAKLSCVYGRVRLDSWRRAVLRHRVTVAAAKHRCR